MFNYNDHCGYEDTFFTDSKLENIVSYMEKLDSIDIPEGSCKGIDINHTEAYDWFVENVLDPLRDYTGRSDLQLIFGFLGDVTSSFKIHKDVKKIPEKELNPNGTQFASFLIPVSVNNDINSCNKSSTLVFEDVVLDTPTNHQLWHNLVAESNPRYQHSVHGWIDHKNYILLKEMHWKHGCLIWWNSLYPHCGIDTKSAGIETKKMLVIHTYV